MKSLTCKQLGGACDKIFKAETFPQIAQMSKEHGVEMYQAKDQPHMDAMAEMMKLMKDQDAMKKWFAEKEALFNAAPTL